jgi:hypothetical protein
MGDLIRSKATVASLWSEKYGLHITIFKSGYSGKLNVVYEDGSEKATIDTLSVSKVANRFHDEWDHIKRILEVE